MRLVHQYEEDKKTYKYVMQFVDLENNIEDTETLSILITIAKIDEELTNLFS